MTEQEIRATAALAAATLYSGQGTSAQSLVENVAPRIADYIRSGS